MDAVECVFELFGHASTRHNRSSSRFGKVIRFYWDGESLPDRESQALEFNPRIVSATISTFLLETSRLDRDNPNANGMAGAATDRMSVSGMAPNINTSDASDTNFNIFEAIGGDLGMAVDLERVEEALLLLALARGAAVRAGLFERGPAVD